MEKRFTRLIFPILFLTLTVSWSAPPCPASDSIHWLSHTDGMAKGDARHQKRLLFFTAEWCSYCGKMSRETFTSPAVVNYINAHYIPIKVDYDRDRQTADIYSVRMLPDTWFVAEDGEQISHRLGFISADKLLPLLQYVATDNYKKMSFSKFLKQCR